MNRILCVIAVALTGLIAARAGADDDAKKDGTVELAGLRSTAPADWKPVQAAGPNRVYQFKVQGEKDEKPADLFVFYFGPGGGGGTQANVDRWKGLFTPPEGKTIDDVTKVERFKVGESEVLTLDVHGTYKFKARPFDPNAKEELLPDSRMIAVIFETAKGPYYVRFVGPAKTVGAHQKEFADWLKAFK